MKKPKKRKDSWGSKDNILSLLNQMDQDQLVRIHKLVDAELTISDISKSPEPSERIFLKIINSVHQQRKQILTAFIAQYDCLPNEVEQILEYTSKGIKWWVQKKSALKDAPDTGQIPAEKGT